MGVVVIEDVNLNAFAFHKKRFLCLSTDDIAKLPRFGFAGTLDDLTIPLSMVPAQSSRLARFISFGPIILGLF